MRSLLVFPFRKLCFHEESLSLVEKNRFASPQRRMAANRWQKAVKTQSLKLNISNFTESELQKKVKSEHVFLNQFLIVNL